MTISFTEINNLPDIVALHRHKLIFPSITGVDNRTLMLTKTRITLPQTSVGHIQAKILGHSIGFRGGLSFENVISVSFFEVSTGANLKSLTKWHNHVRDREESTSLLKSGYAKDGVLEAYDVMGKLIYSFKLLNMFPVVIQYPEFSEDIVPAEISVQFNTDAVLLEGNQLSMSEFNNRFNGIG